MDVWSEDQHRRLEEEVETLISEQWKESVSYGSLSDAPTDPDSLFDDVFKELPDHLRRQREQLRELRGQRDE